MEPHFADIILPIPIPQYFTYRIPENIGHSVEKGMRVVVPFGRKKFYSGIVFNIHDVAPEGYQIKEIVSVLDDQPIVNHQQFEFWHWMAEYYQCSVGEVYKAALPSGLKLESETRVSFNELFDGELKLNEPESLVLGFIQTKKTCNISDIQKNCDVKQHLTVLDNLINYGVIHVNEYLKDTYRPKFKTMVSLSPELSNENMLEKAFDELKRAPKQLELLMTFISLAGLQNALKNKSIEKSILLEKFNSVHGAYNELIKRKIFNQEQIQIERHEYKNGITEKLNTLSVDQNSALDSILNQFETQDTVLLHGVTSSGKTEIYIHLIKEHLKSGKQVLYLLPEIALTTQITRRLQHYFGNSLGIYHSKYSDAERVEIWQDLIKTGRFQIILGARSSIFLPYNNLGLIIVDEEHESSFKQYDPAPRYHARDAAIVLSRLHQSKVLLGTATPSLESIYNVKTNKFGLVNLFKRYQGIKLPEIVIANVREAKRKKQMKSHFTPVLLENIQHAIGNKEQIILFQNRRGFSPYIECGECATIPKCKNCDVSMTYHKKINHVTCHYCGYSYAMPNTCSACGSPALETRGFGTEKIEEEIKIFISEAKIGRLDYDTAKTRKAHERILHEFETGQIDILIGTQMISKGLDFDNVSLVGILDADSMLNYPDFRAFEKSFQMMSQVSGRAGRKTKQGKVILQTTDPDHPIINQVIQNNFDLHYEQQLEERNQFKYPPYYRLITINVKHKNQSLAQKAAVNLTNGLKSVFGDRVLGPQPPLIGRIQNLHIQQITLKLEKKASPSRSKEYIQATIHALIAQPQYRSVVIQIDVDPV